MKQTRYDQVLQMLRRRGVLRPRDLEREGISRVYLSRLYRRGLVERIGRGLYRLPGGAISQHQTLVEVARRIPHGVVCLISALRFHELTTQSPHQVWIAIDRKSREPSKKDLPIRVVWFSGEALKSGVQTHHVDGIDLRVYNPAKTVVDCFKYRNKVGLDVAMEALRDCLKQRKCTIDELWHYARICRVSQVMRPYLEATVAS